MSNHTAIGKIGSNHTVIGIRLDDPNRVLIRDCPEALKRWSQDNMWVSPIFAEYAKGDTISFVVNVTNTSSKIIPNSVMKVHVSTGKAISEWTQLSGVWYSSLEIDVLSAASELAQDKGAFNIKFAGNSGYGKTIRAEAWAKYQSMDFISIECGLMRSPTDWWGRREYNEELGTYIEWSEFSKAVQAGNTVILLDELNRTPTAHKNSLYALLDYRRMANVWGVPLVCGHNTLFVITENNGPQFTGTYIEDRALTNRIQATLVVEAPPPEIEIEIIHYYSGLQNGEAATIVEVLNTLRDEGVENVDITTRTAINVANLAAYLPLRTAFLCSVINNVQMTEEKKHIMDRISDLCR